MRNDLTHIDESGHPRMVDVSRKTITERAATAEALVRFPQPAWASLEAAAFTGKKGPVLDVARVAGTMGVKQTSALIPFCHPLPVSGCSFEMQLLPESCSIRIRCTVGCTARTGVEMEALTGASTAALALYDMTKSLGPEIEIERVRLISKTGGKHDYAAH